MAKLQAERERLEKTVEEKQRKVQDSQMAKDKAVAELEKAESEKNRLGGEFDKASQKLLSEAQEEESAP